MSFNDLKPIGAKKMKDKYGFKRVYIYDGLEALTYIMKIRIDQQSKKQDSVYLTSGLEGSGKSLFNFWAAEIYQEQTGQTITIKHITRNLKEMFGRIYALKNTPSFIALDEGAELDGTNSNTKNVKKTKEKFTVMRKCSHIVFLCFVNPLRITTYFREDRIRGLFFVVKHGEVWFYSNTQDNPHLANIIDSWGKEHDAKSLKFLMKYAPDFIMRNIPEYNGLLRKDYESRKDDNIFNVLKEDAFEDDLVADLPVSEWVTVAEAAKITGLGEGSVRQYSKLGLFNTSKIRGRLHFRRTECLEFKDGKVRNHGLQGIKV